MSSYEGYEVNVSNAEYTKLGSLLNQTLEDWIRPGTNYQSNIKMFFHLFVPFYFIEVFIFPQTGDFVRYSLLGVEEVEECRILIFL